MVRMDEIHKTPLLGTFYNEISLKCVSLIKHQYEKGITDGIKGVLFYGVPGNGKTTTAFKIVERASAELGSGLDWQEHLPVWLDALETRHREIIVRRFGLMGHQVLTLEEVGEEVGLTRERVRQLQIEALRQLRRMIEVEHAD